MLRLVSLAPKRQIFRLVDSYGRFSTSNGDSTKSILRWVPFLSRRKSNTDPKKSTAEEKDINYLVKIGEISKNSLSKSLLEESHPIQGIVRSLKEEAINADNSLQYLRHAKNHIESMNDQYLINSQRSNLKVQPTKLEEEQTQDNSSKNLETSVRLVFSKEYIDRLIRAIEDKEIMIESPNQDRVIRLIDAILLGTASERISEHIRLYGRTMTQQQLQDSFYHLFESELKAILLVFQNQPDLHKHHRKRMKKYSISYLLDVRELNSKSRCVFCWSDPTFSGFKSFPDDHHQPIDTILASRRSFFHESDEIAYKFVSDYTGIRRLYYHDWKEFWQNVRYGLVFFFGTGLLDGIVSTM